MLVEEFFAVSVHGYAVEVLVDGGKEANYFVIIGLAEEMEGPGGIFASGPA